MAHSRFAQPAWPLPPHVLDFFLGAALGAGLAAGFGAGLATGLAIGFGAGLVVVSGPPIGATINAPLGFSAG